MSNGLTPDQTHSLAENLIKNFTLTSLPNSLRIGESHLKYISSTYEPPYEIKLESDCIPTTVYTYRIVEEEEDDKDDETKEIIKDLAIMDDYILNNNDFRESVKKLIKKHLPK